MMANGISDLHSKCIAFAGSMPAIAISWDQVKRDVNSLVTSLRANVQYPNKPSPSLGNVPMLMYGLAY